MQFPFLKAAFIVLASFSTLENRLTAPEKTNLSVVYPKIRIWTTPSSGEEPAFNSPSFQWPSTKKARYSVRISSSKDFNRDLIEKVGIPFAIFNPHKKLNPGKWYWQYKVNNGPWNSTDSFAIKASTRQFVTPDISSVLAKIAPVHPRVLVNKTELPGLRSRAKNYKESSIVITQANTYLDKLPPSEESALPSFKGKNDFENEKIASLASKFAGWNVYDVLKLLSQAYILTGDEKYFITAKKWMTVISKWDPNGPSHLNNFGDSGVMAGLAIGADTFWDLLSPSEREEITNQTAIRARQFYKLWISQEESRSSSMHVWQHILHRMVQTSLALIGKTTDAGDWLEYVYELWIAQSPKLGETDGAWFNGASYFRMNTLTLYDLPFIFKELTAVDFMGSPWYKNNPDWLIYAFPPNSVSDGFCNDANKYPKPTLIYAGYADAAGRRFKNPNASWYANEIVRGWGKDIADDDEFRWFRIRYNDKIGQPEPIKKFDLPQSAAFPDIGVAYMNTSLQNTETNLMLSLRSSPFGPMAHAHADQNTFNIAYGGKRLFYNTGYRPAMGDPHFLGWHKHTQGHNGILIEEKGQPYNEDSWGWIPRFIHGKQISYAVGDASHAYSGYKNEEGANFELKQFRRHYLMLRPSIIVIYDDLEADRPVRWSWLLHNDNELKIDPDKNTIFAANEAAKARVTLLSSSPIDFQVTDQFSVPVDNWTNKTDEEGDTIVFKNQWHFKGISKEKNQKMRYLAIFQVKPDGSFGEVLTNKKEGIITLDNWQIEAEMNSSHPARIVVRNSDHSASLVSGEALTLNGKTYKGKELGSSKLLEINDGKEFFQEVIDAIPASIQNVIKRH